MSEISVPWGTALAKALQSGSAKVTSGTERPPRCYLSLESWCIKPGRGSSGQSPNPDLRGKLSRDEADHG